ncbi:hypothetical protein RB8818 [Rhodopirellula baltica SH 1]|uniref:Uncharacterized protein n=1 Tax=Rhodopirellula baltica (strain DSM 10527 / NCIMB 13988 / SH1) TaxID=243090 RepID=Q7UMI1_RHOBA|nr:hypothetical protein RB8818 [Rhodopirellula baltica SH 1]
MQNEGQRQWLLIVCSASGAGCTKIETVDHGLSSQPHRSRFVTRHIGLLPQKSDDRRSPLN